MGEVFARRYELLDPVAEGGMGAVWRVLDHEDGQVKAAKLLRHSDAGALLRFLREQATRIDHPHVVTPLSWVGEDDTVLFTMPLLRGGSVAMLVGDWGPLPDAWVATILDQVLAALEEVHRVGLVHRDVKPANLLLEPTGDRRPVVRLSDFGIAVPLGQPRLTVAPTVLGTPDYLPPEHDRAADPDPRQDLYAVAVVGRELLAGHAPPFSAELPDTPLGRVLAQAADPDPVARPATARAFRDLLAPLVPTRWEPGHVEVLDQFADESVQGVQGDARRGNPPVAPTEVIPEAVPPPARPPDPSPEASSPEQPAPSKTAAPASTASPGRSRDGARSAVGPLLLLATGVVLLVLAAWLLLGS